MKQNCFLGVTQGPRTDPQVPFRLRGPTQRTNAGVIMWEVWVDESVGQVIFNACEDLVGGFNPSEKNLVNLEIFPK